MKMDAATKMKVTVLHIVFWSGLCLLYFTQCYAPPQKKLDWDASPSKPEKKERGLVG